MAAAVVFAFAVADGLVPVAGAAPYDVLARQLPRLLVARLNGQGDRGVRFFPFLGPIDGQRAFLRPRERFEPAVLARLHQQGDVPLLADAVLTPSALSWRLVDGRTLAVRRSGDLPFDPLRPLDCLPRLEFEFADLLGLQGRPLPPLQLRGEALGWYLVLRDELLRREARLPATSPDPLRAARRCVELAPHDADVHEVVGDFAAHLLRAGERRDEVARLLVPLLEAAGDDCSRLERLHALLLAAGDEASAATAACRAARIAPDRADLVERAAAQAFRLGRAEDVRSVVGGARARGTAGATALAMLAAVCERGEDRALRAELLQDLAARPELPVPVARLLATFLLEDQQAEQARTVITRALPREPGHALLHFELGRACLLLGDTVAAAVALQRALQLGLQPNLTGQAQRFLRLAAVPGLWSATQAIERSVAAGDLPAALAAARALVRRSRRVAEAWFLLGVVTHKVGRLPAAERCLRRALRCDGTSPDAHNRLGILLVASGRTAEGHRHLERAHELAPGDPSPLLHLAQACALLGRQAEAEAHLAAARRCGADPQLADAVGREILAKPA